MTTTIVLGDGGLGHAVAEGVTERGGEVRVLGRPAGGVHEPAAFAGATLVVEASRGPSVLPNIQAAIDGGARRFVIATTAWDADRDEVQAILRRSGAVAVAAPNFSLGVALFTRLVDAAVGLFGRVEAFDPYLLEWHRRTKADRPSRAPPRCSRAGSSMRTRGATSETLEVVSVRDGLGTRDAPRRVRCSGRDRRAAAHGARSLGVRGRDPCRRRLADA